MIAGLISQARQASNGQVAHFGLSFGGNFPAMSGLSGAVPEVMPVIISWLRARLAA